MKTKLLSILIGWVAAWFVFCSLPSVARPRAERVERIMQASPPSHPRLFLAADELEPLRSKISGSPLLKKTFQHVMDVCDRMLNRDPVERKLKGKRMLGVSRTVLGRVVFLSFAYRMTGERKYFKRARRAMLTAASFSNWNPDHFLDVSEMTNALGIGYDWLYSELSEENRGKIRDAIIEKGLTPSMEGGWWVDSTHNWNQVCHGGLTTGALALMEDAPKLARKVVTRAVENVPHAMQRYQPDGAYPEGPSYWTYGTTYNVLLLSALQSALDTTFGLDHNDGFMRSASYYLHATGPTGLLFNYSDGSRRAGVEPVTYWFSRERNRPELLWWEVGRLKRFLKNRADRSIGSRLFPFLLMWSPSSLDVRRPEARHWKGGGPTPVGFHRSGWNEEATYAAIKGGSPETNHAHMDIGSFVIDALGVRWASDLGGQSYHSLEKRDVDLWSMDQLSERWNVFRLNNYSHNTLVVDGEHQRVYGYGHLFGFSENPPMPHSIVDISSAYESQLSRAIRGIGLRRDGSVLLQDRITSLDRKTVVRWWMVTRASVDRSGDGRATLKRRGETMNMRVLKPDGVKLTVDSVERPPHSYDAPNPGVRMIGVELTLAPGSTERIVVHFMPVTDRDPDPVTVRSLRDW